MINTLKNVFTWVGRAITIYTTVVTLVEIDWEGSEGEEKKKTAIEWAKEAGQDLVDKGLVPEWVYSLFFDTRILGWSIDILVKLANRLGFFEKSGYRSMEE